MRGGHIRPFRKGCHMTHLTAHMPSHCHGFYYICPPESFFFSCVFNLFIRTKVYQIQFYHSDCWIRPELVVSSRLGACLPRTTCRRQLHRDVTNAETSTVGVKTPGEELLKLWSMPEGREHGSLEGANEQNGLSRPRRHHDDKVDGAEIQNLEGGPPRCGNTRIDRNLLQPASRPLIDFWHLFNVDLDITPAR